MARNKDDENKLDPATGRPLPLGVSCRGAAQYRARKLVDGVRQTRTFETARLAREWLEGAAVQVREGSFVDRRSLDQTTLEKLVQRFVQARMQIGGKRRGAAEDLGHVPAITGDVIGKLKLSKLTASAVRGFRDRQQEAYSAGTVVKRLNLLAGIIAHAMAEWDLPMPMNPATAKAVSRPDGADVRRDRRLLPPSSAAIREAVEQGLEAPKHEEERLIDAVAKSEWPDDLPVTKLALAQAMRQGEILNLRWGDVNFEQRLLTIRGRHSRGTKTGAHQKTARRKTEIGWEVRPMMPEAADLLLVQLADKQPKPDDLVFASGGNNAFKVRIGRYISRARLEDLTFHDLRHVATSRLAKRFPNPLDLMRVTGHRDLKSLDRYYQPDLSELARVGDADPTDGKQPVDDNARHRSVELVSSRQVLR